MKIYAANIETFEAMQENTWSDYMCLVDGARRERIGQMKQKMDRARSLGAGLLLRYSFLAQGYTKEQWTDVQIQYGEAGKPNMVQYPEFCYSLSHSGKWVICGVHSKELGADIQEMQPWNMRLAKRFFAEEEYERLVQVKDEERKKQMFYKMWTAKESCVKLTGEGIGKGISQYLTSVDFDKVIDTDSHTEMYMKMFEFSNYMVCICARECEGFPEKLEVISIEDFI